jgi:hypothetical protein
MGAYLKSQVSLEFIALVGILLLTYIIFSLAITDQSILLHKKKETILIEDIAKKIQKEITIATRVSDGYYREFNVPETLEGINYTINVGEQLIEIDTEKQGIVLKIPEVIGNISKGINKINKTRGVIYLNQ